MTGMEQQQQQQQQQMSLTMNGNSESSSCAANGQDAMTADLLLQENGGTLSRHFDASTRVQTTTARPTRESVLKRLYEALMRRSLTKIDLSQRGLRSSDAKLVKMALLQNSNLTELKLGYNQLGDEGVTILSKGLCHHQALTLLDLGFNHIGNVGCQALATALMTPKDMNGRSQSTSSLSTLYLAGNLISTDGAMALADAIRSPSCRLQKLHLTGNRLGPEGVAAITTTAIVMEHDDDDAMMMDETTSNTNRNGIVASNDSSSTNNRRRTGGIRELFLGGTSMESMGCEAVGQLLQHSSSLQVISLANCNISDDDISSLAASLKENRNSLPLQALQLSFNNITCKGLDALTNALWGSRTLRELLLDNNDIGERGGHQLANILPHVKTLQVLDVGFNSIQSSGMRTLMKVVAETQNLTSLSVSGNPIDTSAAKAVAYALAYNRSLTSLFLDHCLIEHEGQRHIVAGVVSNNGIALRKLTGFRIGPVIVTIGLPSALEHWTNEQVLNFIHLMWEQSNQQENDEEREMDPLHFLQDSENTKMQAPLDASTVVEVAKRAFASLGDNGETVLTRPQNFHHSLDSPVTQDAIMVEALANGRVPQQQPRLFGKGEHAEGTRQIIPSQGQHYYTNGNGRPEGLSRGPAKSFVAAPAQPAKLSIPDPARKKRIVDWLCKHIQHLNEVSKTPFDPGVLWKLHQHYFSPVVKESGGNTSQFDNASSDNSVNARIVSSVPDVHRSPTAASTVTPTTQSSEDVAVVPQSEPSLIAAVAGSAPTMLKRKVSYRFLGDAAAKPSEVRVVHHTLNGAVTKMLSDGPGMHTMPPKTKRARRNKTRISFLPRIQKKLDSYLDSNHEKALILMRQLYYVEGALLRGDIFQEDVNNNGRPTHLCGVLASEAEMILVDMM